MTRIDAVVVIRGVRGIRGMPTGELGCFYLDPTGQPVRPDVAAPGFAKLARHYGSVKGAWPRIVEE